MKYLILGGNGLIGKSLLRELATLNHEFTATYNNTLPGTKTLICNILNQADLDDIFNKVKPDIVINATNLAGGVDYCENNPHLAKEFHLSANSNIGNLCIKHKAKMVLVSTDYVFDGQNPPYHENDITNPLNKYGFYKLEAELWMQSHLKNYMIVRTTNVFGWDPLTKTPNFLMGLYFRLNANQTAHVPSFLSGNPTHVSSLAKAIIELTEKDANGIFHVVGSSFIDRFSWAKKFCELMNFSEELLIEIPSAPKNIVPRPFNSNLSVDKFISKYSSALYNVNDGLSLFLKEMEEHN